MKNAIAVILILVVIGLALGYIIKTRKSGKKCIGCPDTCFCNAKKNSTLSDCQKTK